MNEIKFLQKLVSKGFITNFTQSEDSWIITLPNNQTLELPRLSASELKKSLAQNLPLNPFIELIQSKYQVIGHVHFNIHPTGLVTANFFTTISPTQVKEVHVIFDEDSNGNIKMYEVTP